MAQMIKYIPTHSILMALNEDAIKASRNMTLSDKIAMLPEAHYPISWTMLHSDMGEVRCRVVLTAEGDTGYLDMDISTFEILPEMEIPDEIPEGRSMTK